MEERNSPGHHGDKPISVSQSGERGQSQGLAVAVIVPSTVSRRSAGLASTPTGPRRSLATGRAGPCPPCWLKLWSYHLWLVSHRGCGVGLGREADGHSWRHSDLSAELANIQRLLPEEEDTGIDLSCFSVPLAEATCSRCFKLALMLTTARAAGRAPWGRTRVPGHLCVSPSTVLPSPALSVALPAPGLSS